MSKKDILGMAVKTSFTADDFRQILVRYNLGTLVDYAPFAQGTDQTNLLLTTTQRAVVLRYYEKRTLDYAAFEIALLQYLTRHTYPCAAPIADQAGCYLSLYKEKPLALFELLPGEHADNPQNALQVAEVIGKLHTLTIRYQPPTGGTRPTYDQAYCWSWAAQSAGRIGSEVEAKRRLAWMQGELAQLVLPEQLPRGVCHSDLNPSNFLYQQGKLSGVLDFDQASYTWLLYDVGQLLYWWAWPDNGELDLQQSRTLLKHYEQQRPMTGDEHEHLFDALKLVILIGIGWFLDDDDGCANAQRKIALLNDVGRVAFSEHLFGDASAYP
jgi:homoserine kinase type II